MRRAAVGERVDRRIPEAALEWGTLDAFGAEERSDRERLRWAVAGALLLHGLFLLSRAPDLATAASPPPERREVVALTRYRLQPPEPPRDVVRERHRVRVPVPDPTPEELEPVRPLEVELPPLDLPFDDGLIAIPEAPPAPAEDGAPIPVGGEVVAPRKLVAPMPAYTEIARLARIQGLVVLRATIDRDGRVTDARIEKGLGFGLDEASLETVRRWTFEPATLRGRPVAVYYYLTVRFEMR